MGFKLNFNTCCVILIEFVDQIAPLYFFKLKLAQYIYVAVLV